ncbi:hypothetical protein G3A39_38195 [Paraburkholderia aspalathi]|nr:hypothetical protein [Paraburkholderia aspalathi]
MSAGPRVHNASLYAALLLGQTASTFLLFWMVFPIFINLVTHLGEIQDIRMLDQAVIIGSSVLLHCFYWSRLKWVSIVRPCRNIVVAHFCSFASRVSFFFGGALFSVVFFRHIPELDFFPPFTQATAKLLYLVAILFGLFCYSTELDRLAKAIEGPATGELD